MKQKDIIVIMVAVFVSGVASFFISNKLFASPKDRQTKVEVVRAITSEFNEPDKKYFNTNSIDPTQLIKIGTNQNTQPFNAKTN